MPPALSANSWIATLRGYHQSENDVVATFSKMLSDLIAISGPGDEKTAEILDFYALQLLSTGGLDGRD
jgi:hypothetical protein